MINFGSTFLDGEVAIKRTEVQQKIGAILKKEGLTYRDEAAKPIIEKFLKTNPMAFADIEIVADHIDHVVKLAGIDHVGFGSDFDGVGDSLPTGLKDVRDYPNLIYTLLVRGYSESDIEKVCSGNLFRVWNEVIAYAETH
jgi:membrane dipeptidase